MSTWNLPPGVTTNDEYINPSDNAREYIAKLRAELKHAKTQYRRALAREQVAALNMGHVVPSAKYVRLHALALRSTQKWLGAIVRAKRSLAIMGADNVDC